MAPARHCRYNRHFVFVKNAAQGMLKRFIDRLRGRRAADSPSAKKAHIIARGRHGIARQRISSAAVKVLEGLQGKSYQAYLVGGGVRDLLLGLTPKDFDVATSATPEQVRALFRNARIIGRRFRLVHVLFGRETIEVATFRAHHEQDEQRTTTNAQGMIVHDNVYGQMEEDAERRDFTVNALYYDVADETIHDYVGGVNDLEARLLRLIGHPETRYREDPVRMLRAIRFAAKLDFRIEAHTAAPLPHLASLLTGVSPHRLADEVDKLLGSGHAETVLALLEEYGLLHDLFPDLHLNDASRRLILATAQSTDARLRIGKGINPAFFYAALLWQPVQVRSRQLHDHGTPLVPALQQAIQQVIQQQMTRTALTRVLATTLREIWEMQTRLQNPDIRRVDEMLQSPRFRAGFDFLVLREQSGEPTGQMGDWWQHYQDADSAGRQALQAEVLAARRQPDGAAPKRRRRPPRKRKPV